jgi:dipeptidyl aminopeptidase/acylaminoacyl peptidase
LVNKDSILVPRFNQLKDIFTGRHFVKNSISFQGDNKKLFIPDYVKDIPSVVNRIKGDIGAVEYEGYYKAVFSPGSLYCQLTYLGPDIPWQKLIKTDQINVQLKLLDKESSDQRELQEMYAVPIVEYFHINNENGDGKIWLI